MKSRTLASERTHLFNVKLKHHMRINWYLVRLGELPLPKCPLPKSKIKKEFKINKIGFFKEHVWYHFINNSLKGWLPAKLVRKNYRRLEVPFFKPNQKFNSCVTAALMICKYERPQLDLKSLSIKNWSRPVQFFNLLVDNVGSYKNLSHKSARRLRNQLLRCRPVIMWIKDYQYRAILLIGFNRRLFFYLDPSDNEFRSITWTHLLRAWRKSFYWAISY